MKLTTLCLLMAGAALAARADDLAEKGRDIFNKHHRAVVTIQIVQKTSFSMQGRGGMPANESKHDITGTVVDASGLTVTALSSCEPDEMINTMMGGLGEDSGFKMETELSDVKILLDDGTEIPAEIVLRDKDLDLAFVRPKNKPAKPMTTVDLANSGPVQILEQVITLNRLSKAAGRAYSASVERISAVVQKPRRFYIPDSTMTATSLGSPAFSLDGKILGVFVMRSISSGGSGMGMFSMRPEGMTSIILPAADVLKAAKQAPEAKGDDAAKEAPKEEKN